MDIKDKHRKKLLEAIVYFASNVKNPTKMMIYKMLAELDFRHFEQTGLSVTNSVYVAFEKGPVPKKLHDEITQDKKLVFPDDFKEALSVQKEEFVDKKSGKDITKFTILPKRKADLSVFSPRQKKIMEEIAFIYRDSFATTASKASHEYDKPWYKTIKKSGLGSVIDYLEQITHETPVTKEEAKELQKEASAFKSNYNG